jgi:DeoR/GlpR family transcriptional regulator of sugar metabolism
MIMRQNPALAEERLDQIRALLRQRHAVRVDRLAGELRVSDATIRRDLQRLTRDGVARRVHGGAVTTEGRAAEPRFDDKTARMAAEKERIARAAAALVGEAEAVFLDGGSTVLALARLLASRGGLTVLTNSLRVAALFSAGGPRMILTGGEFRPLSQTLVGPLTRPLIERLHVDTAFIGTIGLDPDAGLTTTDPREAETKELVMAHARRVVVLADSSKLGACSLVRFGDWPRHGLLITNRGAPRDLVGRLRKRIEVRTV